MTDHPMSDEVERETAIFGYAYVYPDPSSGRNVVRFGTGGRRINGSPPLDTIPLCRQSDLLAALNQRNEARAAAIEEARKAFDQLGRISVASPFWNDDSRQTLATVRDAVMGALLPADGAER